jgi:hypothetical protein
MLRTIREQGRKLSPSDIIDLESMIGYEIPSDYKKFLLMYNGGVPDQHYHDVQNTEGTNIGSFVGMRCFYWIDGPENKEPHIKELYSLKDTYSVYHERIPSNFLPISEDDGGNLICLSLYGEDCGSIWYWDHEAEHSPPDYRNCYKVANSFQELLDGMFDYDFENDVRLP